MFSALIVYGSTTGNTESAAQIVQRVLTEAGGKVTLVDATDAVAEGLCSGYDLVLLGCSTWGHESIELQDDFIPLFDNLDQTGVSGKSTAVFGCGEVGYTYFCGAVDAISDRLHDLGARVIDTLKIDGDPYDTQAEIELWARHLAETL